jgi:DNA-binding winged helix-turn-helix (wHTH) protein/TolB-like protein
MAGAEPNFGPEEIPVARIRFGVFDFDPKAGELLRDGVRVHLQPQPAKLLGALLAARGAVVTRDSLRQLLWSDGTSVDFDRSLNFAIAQVRMVLGDSSDSPRFIRTVPKRGYQFIAPLAEAEAPQERIVRSRRSLLAWPLSGGAAALAIALAWMVWPREKMIAVARFDNETGVAELDRFADGVTDSLVADLTAVGDGRLGVIGNAAVLRRPRSFQNLDEIASTLRVQYAILGQVQRAGERIRILAHLIRLPQKTHVKVTRLETDAGSELQSARRIAADLGPKLGLPAAANN